MGGVFRYNRGGCSHALPARYIVLEVPFMEVHQVLRRSFFLHRVGPSLSHYQFVVVFKQCLGRIGYAVADSLLAPHSQIGVGIKKAAILLLGKERTHSGELGIHQVPGLCPSSFWWKYEHSFIKRRSGHMMVVLFPRTD